MSSVPLTQLNLAFQHPLYSLDMSTFPKHLSPFVAIGGQWIILVVKQEFTCGQVDTGPKLQEEL